MTESRYTPERIRALHCKEVGVTLSPKYISIESEEIWKGNYFSRTGWCIHAPRDPSPQWLGENFRKALMTSEYFNKPGIPVDRERLDAMKAASNERQRSFNNDIMRTYGYKKFEQIGQRCDVVFGSWHDLVDDFILLKASKRRPGGHSLTGPMGNKDYERFLVRVPVSASDEALGLAIRDALARCVAPGRQKINAPAEWCTIPA